MPVFHVCERFASLPISRSRSDFDGSPPVKFYKREIGNQQWLSSGCGKVYTPKIESFHCFSGSFRIVVYWKRCLLPQGLLPSVVATHALITRDLNEFEIVKVKPKSGRLFAFSTTNKKSWIVLLPNGSL